MKLRVKLRNLAAGVSLVAAGAIALSATPARAFSFQTDFTSGSDAAKGDIFLKSVTLESGDVVSDFSLINAVNVRENLSTGAASADIGDLATTGASQEDLTDAGAVAVLNNLNLNNIIDVEDSGSFVMDLQFEKAADSFFIFERGRNSRLNVQALDADGNAIGNVLELSNSRDWDYAGFEIDTNEIAAAQQVGSIGVSLMDLGVTTGPVSALQVSSQTNFNGPDFKLFGKIAFGGTTKRVPEPSVLLGMGVAVAGLLSAGRRKQEKSA